MQFELLQHLNSLKGSKTRNERHKAREKKKPNIAGELVNGLKLIHKWRQDSHFKNLTDHLRHPLVREHNLI